MTARLKGSEIPMGTTEVARIVGLTYRQLDYWQRVGAIAASRPADGSGTAVEWSELDVTRLRRIKRASDIFRTIGFHRAHFSVAVVKGLWDAPLNEPFVVEGQGCRLIVDP